MDWKSSKQSTTAMSATIAEYIAASEAAIEAVWIRKFISGLGIVPTINMPIKMFCDNSAALLIANEPGVQKGARHYHRRYHYVRECIELGEINLLKVHTDDNLADPFTKALPKGKLTQHARSIGLQLMNTYDMDEFCEYNALDLGWGLCPSIEVRQAYRQFAGAVVELIDRVVNDEEFKEAALAVYRLFGAPGERGKVI
ncbi:hypothetical protein Tco_1102298 [Tanacetum coccineum]